MKIIGTDFTCIIRYRWYLFIIEKSLSNLLIKCLLLEKCPSIVKLYFSSFNATGMFLPVVYPMRIWHIIDCVFVYFFFTLGYIIISNLIILLTTYSLLSIGNFFMFKKKHAIILYDGNIGSYTIINYCHFPFWKLSFLITKTTVNGNK